MNKKNLKNKERILEKYKKDELLFAALNRLFNLFETEEKIREECNLSTGAWYSLIKGKAREGARVSIIARAAAGAIIQDLVPHIVNKTSL
jgi:hypothetical protein